jgi:hypothetical protein
MPCLIALFALLVPRVTLFLLWLFSDYLARAYDTVLWPVLGFVFTPLATLAYAFAMNDGGGLQGFYLVLFIVALLVDLGIIGGSARRKK